MNLRKLWGKRKVDPSVNSGSTLSGAEVLTNLPDKVYTYFWPISPNLKSESNLYMAIHVPSLNILFVGTPENGVVSVTSKGQVKT